MGDTRNVLAGALRDNLNKKFKDHRVAHFLGEEESPNDLTEWISTGSTMLDIAISNRDHGGLPVGRIIEITGMEASGKSLLAAHVLANTQKMGGIAVFIDTENAVSQEFLEAIGVDIQNLLYVQLETVEDIYESIVQIVTKIKESSKDQLVTIVVDSMAAASTKVEMEADFEKDGWSTTKAIVNSKAMRKITQLIGRQRVCLVLTNQLRTKLGVTFGENTTTSGGMAIKYHASVILKLKASEKLKAKDPISGVEKVIGIKTNATVAKNRCGPPLRTASFNMYFNSGIDDMGCWLDVLKENKIIHQAGAWSTYTTDAGKELKFYGKDFETLLEDPKLKEEIYRKIVDRVIMKYKKKGEKVEIDRDNIIADTKDLVTE